MLGKAEGYDEEEKIPFSQCKVDKIVFPTANRTTSDISDEFGIIESTFRIKEVSPNRGPEAGYKYILTEVDQDSGLPTHLL